MTLGERIGQALHDAGIGPVGRVVLPAEQRGEVPKELLFVQRGPRLHAVVMVDDLGVSRSVFAFGDRNGATGFLGDSGDGEVVVARAVERVSAWLASPRFARPTALDLACTALVLLRPMLRPGTFLRMTTFGEWDARTASGAAIGLGGAEEWGPIFYAWHVEHGLSVRLTGDRAETTRTLDLATFEDADAALPGLVADATRAVSAWRAFAARPLRVDHVGDAIVDALGGSWFATASTGDWPNRLPTGAVWFRDHLGEHHVLALEETAGGVTGPGFVVRSRADLDAAVPVALEFVARWQARLTPDKLEPGRRYRVLAAAAGVAAGTILRFVRAQYIPYDGVTRYEFDGVSLWEGDPAADPLLADLPAWLEPE